MSVHRSPTSSVKKRMFAWSAYAFVIVGGCLVTLSMYDSRSEREIVHRTSENLERLRAARIERPVLHPPELECNARARQADVVQRLSTVVHQEDFKELRRDKGGPGSPRLRELAQDHAAELDTWSAAGRCRWTTADARDDLHAFEVKDVISKLAQIRAAGMRPEECMSACLDGIRAAQDDDPLAITGPAQQDAIRWLGSQLAICYGNASPETHARVLLEVESWSRSYRPLSDAIVMYALAQAEEVLAYDEAHPLWARPFRGVRAQLQFHQALAAARALTANPDAWRAVDVEGWGTRKASLAAELRRRRLPSIPFGNGLVSPGWDIAVHVLSDPGSGLEVAALRYVTVQALVTILRATLSAPAGPASEREDLRDPFGDGPSLRWTGSQWYSVGRNGTDDGARGDDIVLHE